MDDLSAQGSSQALYVSYHGQTDASAPDAVASAGSANLDIIDKDGFVARNVLGPVSAPAELKELRGLAFSGEYLWVVSGAESASQVLRFTATMSGGVHQFVDLLTSHDELASISHPFDIAFDPTTPGWFVSNQDTNVVVGPFALGTPPLPTPPVAEYLREKFPDGSFCPGTFVASAVSSPVACQSELQLVPSPQGLEGTFTQSVNHSVRGLAHDGDLLYVADEAAGAVKTYDATGALVWQFGPDDKPPIKHPVHLLLAAGGLFIGSSGNDTLVFLVLPERRKAVVVADKIKDLSGMAIDATGRLYYASRSEQRVYRLTLKLSAADAEAHAPGEAYGPPLPQAPEFITCAP